LEENIMSSAREWHVPRPDGPPLGPLTAEEVLGMWQRGEINATRLCWREGMPHWLSLRDVEPFAARMRSAPVQLTATEPANAPLQPAAAERSGAPRQSAAAVWSLVLGILAIIPLSVLAGIPAIVCGHVARRRIKKSGGARRYN
jgi:hypothetical protein